MKKVIGITIITLFALSRCKKDTPDTPAYDQSELLTNIANNFIDPALADFNTKALALETVCNNPSDSATWKADLQNAWKALSISWRALEPFNIGDFKTTYIFDRLDTWLVDSAAIQSTLNSVSVLTQSDLNSLSSRNVGFSGLEFLIFEDLPISNPRFTELLSLMAGEVVTHGTTLQNTWDGGYKATFIAAKGTELSASMSQIINALPVLLEETLRDKIAIPIGYYSYTEEDFKNYEAFRSQTSLEIIQFTLEAIEALYKGGASEGMDDWLIAEDASSVHTEITNTFDELYTKLNTLQTPLAQNQTANYQGLEDTYFLLKKLRGLFTVDLPSELGILITFSDVDGD